MKIKGINKRDSASAFIIRGIAKFNDGDSLNALRDFIIADTNLYCLALLNYKKAKCDSIIMNEDKKYKITKDEDIQGFSIFNIDITFDINLPIANPEEINKNYNLKYKEFNNFDILVFENESGSYYFISTKPNYSDTSNNGLKIGMDEVNAEEIFGTPNEVIYLRQYNYYIYNYHSIAIQINEKNKVAGWFLYRIMN